MSRSRAALTALLVGWCLTACGGTAQAQRSGTGGLKTIGVRTDGHSRTYLLYVPPGDSAAHPLPLVLVYHGAGDTAQRATTETDLLNLAQRGHDMILVFPQGYGDSWNEGTGHTPAEQAGIDDVAFSRAILGRVESHYAIDRHAVVATGLSNGALLTEFLGCKLAAELTMIVPVEGQLPEAVSGGCRPGLPINVYEVHGTADRQIPYGGGPFTGAFGGTDVLAAPASASRWAALDHCSSRRHGTAPGNAVLSVYAGCRDRVSVTLASIQGGGHNWPADFGQTILGLVSALRGGRRIASG